MTYLPTSYSPPRRSTFPFVSLHNMTARQTQEVNTMVDQCLTNVEDGVPTPTQHRVEISCLPWVALITNGTSLARAKVPPTCTRRWATVGVMLGQRRRRWTSIAPTVAERLLFSRMRQGVCTTGGIDLWGKRLGSHSVSAYHCSPPSKNVGRRHCASVVV